MKKIKVLLPVIIVIFISVFNTLQATDLVAYKIIPPYLLEWEGSNMVTIPENLGDGAPICAIIKNDSILEAKSYKVIFEVREDLDQDVVIWSNEQTGTNLLPYTSDTIYSKNWFPSMRAGEIRITVEFGDDVVPENNKNVLYVLPVQHPNNSKKIIRNLVTDFGKEDPPQGYFYDTPLVPGQIITTGDSAYQYTVKDASYMVYMPYVISDKFNQPSEIYYVNAQDSTVRKDSVNSWINIDGSPFLADTWSKINSGNQIFGSPAEVDTISDFEVVHEEVTVEKKDSACALIVSGRMKKKWEKSSFTKDLDFVEANLKGEQYGPQLNDDQIVRLENASAKEIFDALRKMREKCTKVYFYYTGHGGNGFVYTNDPSGERLLYPHLVDSLAAIKADNVTVILDACYSGSAEGWFRGAVSLDKQNYTLITSSMSTRTSLTRNVLTTANGETYNPGFFTWNLMKCFGDPRADKDGDGKTSMIESYNWLRAENPKTANGSMNRLQNPQIIVHEVPVIKPEQTVVSGTETKVKLEFKAPLDEGTTVQIIEQRGIQDSTSKGDSIVSISTERYYTLNMNEQLSVFNVDVTLKYDKDIDLIKYDVDYGVGIVKRDSAGVDWAKVPSVHMPELNTVTAKGIDGFSDFAFAIVIPENVTSIRDHSTIQEVLVYPNPVTDYVNLVFNSERSGEANIKIIDIAGSEVLVKNIQANIGKNKLEIPFKDRIPGLYFLSMKLNGKWFTTKLLIE